MDYRFIRVTSNYPQFIKSFYSKNKQALTLPYEEQHNLLINDSIENASSMVRNLNKISGVTATEIISNAFILQDTWRKENNLSDGISNQDLVIEQIKQFSPDVVWLDDFALLDNAWKTKLLKEVPSIKLFIGHHCAPFNESLIEKLRLFDFMFTCIPCLKKELEQFGIQTYLLYHGFDDSVLDYIHENNKFPNSEFVFSGSLYSGSGFHKSRVEYIESMLKSGIKIDLYCNLESFKKLLTKKLFYYIINILNRLRLNSVIEKISFLNKNKSFGNTPIQFYSKKLLKNSKAPVFGKEMYQLLAKSNICFNIHGEVADKCAGNVRLFEATGIGTCLVTDWKENISELFVPEKEIVTYKSVEECIEKVKWLLNNPEERNKIAKAGQLRTLKDHTFKSRAKTLDEIIKTKL